MTAGAAGALLATTGLTPALAISARPQRAPSFNGPVYAIAYRGDIVYVGGAFTGVTSGGRTVVRQRLAAFDAQSGALLSWAPAADGTVKALAVDGDQVYAAGKFSAVSGNRRDHLARLDARSGAVDRFAHSVSGEAVTLAVGDGRLYLGGRFNAVDGSRRRSLAAFSLSTRTLDSGWQPSADGRVFALATSGPRVYVGGSFHRVNAVGGTAWLAAVTTSNGASVGGFRPRLPAEVRGLAVEGDTVYAATGGRGGRAVAFTIAGEIRWTHLFNGDAHAITALDGIAYVGGHFDKACRLPSRITQAGCASGSVPRVKLAAVDSHGQLTAWNPQANGVVGIRALATNQHQVAAGGEFTTIGGLKQERFAAFD